MQQLQEEEPQISLEGGGKAGMSIGVRIECDRNMIVTFLSHSPIRNVVRL